MRGSYYDVLGLTPSSSEDEIRVRYLYLMRRYHPDHNRTPFAHARTAAINEAYRFLSDATLRAGHNAQLAAQRQDFASALSLDLPPSRGRALVVRRRRSPFRRHAARLALILLLVSTGVVGWQIENRLLGRDATVSALIGDTVDNDEQRAISELMAASAREAEAMPPLSSAAIKQGASAFRRLVAKDPGGTRVFSGQCHTNAADDGSWDALDYCVAFDEAAYASRIDTPAFAMDTGYFIDRHDRATHFYMSKLSNIDMIEGRVERIQTLVRSAGPPQRSGPARVLHGISKRGRKLADAAWQVIDPDPTEPAVERPAHDF